MTPETDEDLTLTVTRLIAAPPKQVFDAWLDPDMLTRFMLSGPGMGCRSARTDPRVGGDYLIVMTSGDTDIPHHGIYSEITPHSRIAFTWNSPHSAPDSTVAVDFAPEAGGTRVTLTQVRFKSESSREGHRGGWTAILDTLGKSFG
jgi:uncharacterized protein YndB with AHSA1/START domain